jgi:hypothetical protein
MPDSNRSNEINPAHINDYIALGLRKLCQWGIDLFRARYVELANEDNFGAQLAKLAYAHFHGSVPRTASGDT